MHLHVSHLMKVRKVILGQIKFFYIWTHGYNLSNWTSTVDTTVIKSYDSLVKVFWLAKRGWNYKLELGTLDKFSKTDNYLIITKKTLRLAAC